MRIALRGTVERADTRREVAHDPDEAHVRRVRRQLGILTVGLLVALLLLSGVLVYLRARDVLLQPIRQAIQLRASEESHHLFPWSLHAPSGQFGPGGQIRDQELSGVFDAFVDSHLNLLGGSPGPFDSALPDPAAAREALRTGQAAFSTVRKSGDSYLIYSKPVKPVWAGDTPLGVVQTGMSEGQYLAGLDGLVRILLIVGGIGVLAAAAITVLLVQRALLPIRAALRRQRTFVADAAHELRTPLSIIRSSAELGLAGGTEEEQERAEETLRQSNHLTRLIDDLLLLARADSGALAVERKHVELDSLVTETLHGVEVLAEDRGSRLEAHLQKGTGVLGDALRLRQLLLILLDNALRYTPPGGVIEVGLDRHRGRARLRVHDSGPGIDPRDLPHIFDRFYRAERARPRGGVGLGLSIAHWIAEVHGGQIVASNAPEGGAVFTATLPLASS